MNYTPFFIKNNMVHLWRAQLTDYSSQKQDFLSILSADEKYRAGRFKFPVHEERFTIARSLLRQILSLYIQIPPQDIIFSYGEHGKPYVRGIPIHFNVSHSDTMAIYAFTDQEIGVDIEKIEPVFKQDVAKRLFSLEEYNALINLPEEHERIRTFYQIWSRKEAIIKILGQGLYVPLKDFTITSNAQTETVSFFFMNKTHHYHINSFRAHPNYESAFAIENAASEIVYWQLDKALSPRMGWDINK